VTRYTLESNSSDFLNKRIGLILIASPSYGSGYADTLSPLIAFYRNRMGRELRWGAELLDDLDARFRNLIFSKFKDILYGKEFTEHQFVTPSSIFPTFFKLPDFSKLRKFFPFSPPPIVSKMSSGRFFQSVTMIPGSDHFSICKPRSMDDMIHTSIVNFLHSNNLLSGQQPASIFVRERQPEIVSGVGGGITPIDLFRFGNRTTARLSHIRIERDVNVFVKDDVTWVMRRSAGASTFSRPFEQTHLHALWRLPVGTRYPPNLLLFNDMLNHWSWIPAHNMTLQNYCEALAAVEASFLRM
jgi:hypothetical protein